MTDRPAAAPNYTNAFLVTSGGILFMAFFTLAALAGFVWVMLTAVGIERVIRWLGRRGTPAGRPPVTPPRD